ncbi:methyltransferase family protein [Psychromonas sp. Urea-02u-13]|uniref:methyltransferase family protein n=1 Tax=Psychromonas sp. Urea-02u-13 TaxID=2058326 RepID=UPI000C338984|nr:methyltransferase [Psychromonas sp. Urea-02u-13]PKG38950.1 isoprenylcysteine carboxylmethyltransferase family protein [Psychromonas sp. Urea-02u-13]
MFYVIAQFLLLAVIAWPLASLSFSIVGLFLMVLGALIALSALMANRPGNFNVRPKPKETGALIVHGPYKFIRHPMYSSLIFGSLGFLFCQFSFWKLGAWLLLIVVLVLKARFEEKALCAHYAAYHVYQKSNKALIPWIW